MKTTLIAALGLLIPLSSSAQDSAVRLWTNQQGRTVKATLVEVSGTNVVIQLENGTKSTVVLGTLSKADQEYVRNQQAAKPVPGGKPASNSAAGALEWPKEVIAVDPKSIVVTPGVQDEAARRFHYTTGSFEYICTAPLAGTVMSEVAADFELVKNAFQRVPWGFDPKPSKSPFFQIYLTETDEDYIALGGDDRSASMTTNDGKSLVRFRTLGLKRWGHATSMTHARKSPGRSPTWLPTF